MGAPPLPSGFLLHRITLSRVRARAGLDALKRLLDVGTLDEGHDILPLFRTHAHLGALLSRVYFIDTAQQRLAVRREVALGFFRADFVVADLHRNHYLLVEFEHGHHDSIFGGGGRSTPLWSPTFERGYSQVIDWFWWLSREAGSASYRRLIQRDVPLITGLLVVGRDVPPHEVELRERLAWRANRTRIDSNQIYISTYGELYRALESNWHTL